MSHWTDDFCANFEEAPVRAQKRVRYVCLTMSLHWFKLWLGAVYTIQDCLNQWWHKPTMYICVTWSYSVNIWRPRQNGRHLLDDIFKYISWTKMYEFWLWFHWNLFRPGDKPSCEPMMVRLPTHMRVTRHQFVNVETHKVTETFLWADSHYEIRDLALNWK